MSIWLITPDTQYYGSVACYRTRPDKNDIER